MSKNSWQPRITDITEADVRRVKSLTALAGYKMGGWLRELILAGAERLENKISGKQKKG